MFILPILPIPFTFSFFLFPFLFMVTIYVFIFFLQFNTFYCTFGGRRQRKWNSNWLYYLLLLCYCFGHFTILFYFLLFIAEEVSARIVQVVTAEAVAVLKGEQEKEAQHTDQPAALPLGKREILGPGAGSAVPWSQIKSSCSKRGHISFFIHQKPRWGCTGTYIIFTFPNRVIVVFE